MIDHHPPKILLGWQEWCALPKLRIPAIKTKMDTGAKTAALHASEIEPFHRQGQSFVRFNVHPLQRNHLLQQHCTAPIVDQRLITNSGGHKELRYIIHTRIHLGTLAWDIEVSLTNRDPMVFRMLLGREALKGHSIIDPAKILCQGKMKNVDLRKLYKNKPKEKPCL